MKKVYDRHGVFVGFIYDAGEMDPTYIDSTHPDLSDWENARRRVVDRLWAALHIMEECAKSEMFHGRVNPLRPLIAVVTTVRDYISVWRES